MLCNFEQEQLKEISYFRCEFIIAVVLLHIDYNCNFTCLWGILSGCGLFIDQFISLRNLLRTDAVDEARNIVRR